MARIDLKNKAIQAKLVYYGPGLCGKTTNLQYINEHLAGGDELMSLATEGDRTIFFDFMPLDLGKLRGLDVQFKLYTVPGQVRYNQTRKMVLKNVDGVVFVADSQKEMIDANGESLENLFENLRELGIDPDALPVVLQYNKRDLPNVMTTGELDTELNTKGFSTFMASAATGDGVVETLKAACKQVLAHLSKTLPGREETPASAPTTKAASPAPDMKLPASPAEPAAASRAPVNGSAKEAAPQSADAPPQTSAAPSAEQRRTGTPSQYETRAEPWPVDALRRELAELRGPVRLDDDAIDKLADRLVSKPDMIVLHRRVDGVEETARNTGTLVDKLLERVGAIGEQIAELGGKLEQRLGTLSSPKVELPAQLHQLPTKADLMDLAKKLQQLESRLASAGGSKVDVAEAVRDLAGKRDLEAVSARLQGIAEQSAAWEAGRADLVALKQALESLARREDLTEIRTAVLKVSAPATTAKPSAELRDLAARLESLPTKAELAALAQRLGTLPTRGDLQRLDGRLTETLAQMRALAEAPRPRTAQSEAPASPNEATAPAEAPSAAAADVAPEQTEQSEQAAPAETAPTETEQTAPIETERTAPTETEQATPTETEQTETEQAAPTEAAAENETSGEQPAAEAAAPVQPPEPFDVAANVDDDSPEHKNAARVARVMMADLYLYNKEQVEAGIREDDFFERNHDALEDMRLTYESRIPAEVRAQKDHLRLAIETFIEKKRAKLASS